jgi:C4-dicarboxylate-specific signal transduction histidine kinase
MDRAMMASAMSASIAHELNQPLGAILNNAETAEILLSKDSTDRDELKEILADIRRDDERAAEIIKRLRMLLKHSDLETREIELADVITDTIKLVEHQAIEHGVTIKVAPLSARLRVRADPIHLQQVLLNIALNAIEAMQNIPEGARELKVRVDQLEGGEVRVSIEDNGPGIPVDKLKRIFEPFVTTKRQGTGIGLSIAKTIIGTYGGRIWAENGPHGGAIFHFTLHVATADLEAV